MAAPRILLIHPGHLFATSDVYTGLAAGLHECGVDVVPYPLDHTLRMMNALLEAGDATDLFAVEGNDVITRPDPFLMAGAGVPGMAMAYQVDAVLAVTGCNLPATVPETLRRGKIPTALICTESPYMTDYREKHDAGWYRHVFTNERNAVAMFTNNPPERVHYLPHAYNPRVHQPSSPDPALVCDAYFVGTAFDERKELFGGVNWAGIDHRITGALWHGTDSSTDIIRGVVKNADAAKAYASARININHHRTSMQYGDGTHVAPQQVASLGPRAYEIAACGGFQVMDDSRAEARDVFGDSLVTYRSGDSADLERVIRHWLKRPDARAARAAAQHAAIAPHTWTARAERVLTTILD